MAFPAIYGINSAVPAPGGTGYVALTYANPRGGIAGADEDGDLAAGYTFGDAITGVSLTIGAAVTGLEPFGDSGNFNISASRMVRAGGASATFIGASAGNIGAWGSAANSDESYNVYVSHLVGVQASDGEVPFQFTLGYGTQTTYADDGSGDLGEGVFYGFGFGVTPNLSASLSGTETQVNMGLALTVPQVPGLSLSAGISDVTENVDRRQVAVSVAFGF